METVENARPGCEQIEVVFRFLEGDMGAARAAVRHVSRCDACRELLALHDLVTSTMRAEAVHCSDEGLAEVTPEGVRRDAHLSGCPTCRLAWLQSQAHAPSPEPTTIPGATRIVARVRASWIGRARSPGSWSRPWAATTIALVAASVLVVAWLGFRSASVLHSDAVPWTPSGPEYEISLHGPARGEHADLSLRRWAFQMGCLTERSLRLRERRPHEDVAVAYDPCAGMPAPADCEMGRKAARWLDAVATGPDAPPPADLATWMREVFLASGLRNTGPDIVSQGFTLVQNMCAGM